MKTITVCMLPICIVWFSISYVHAQQSPARIEEVRESIIRRAERIQNITADYQSVKTYSSAVNFSEGRVTTLPNGSTFTEKSGEEISDRSFRFLEGKSWYEQHVTDGIDVASSTDQIPYEVISYTENRVQRLWKDKIDGAYQGMIYDFVAYPNEVLDLAIGLRRDYSSRAALSADWRDAAWELDSESGDFTAVFIDEQDRKHIWRFDPDLGNSLVNYEIWYQGNIRFQLTNTNFREVNGILLPENIDASVLVPKEGELVATVHHSVVVKNYSLDSPSNTPESYEIAWPVGTRVFDSRSGLIFEVRSGVRTLSDEFIARSADLRLREMADKAKAQQGSMSRPTPTLDPPLAADSDRRNPSLKDSSDAREMSLLIVVLIVLTLLLTTIGLWFWMGRYQARAVRK